MFRMKSVIATFVAVLFWAAPARAGVRTPGPATSPDVERWCLELAASDAQTRAVLVRHDSYRTAYAAAIERFNERHAELLRTRGWTISEPPSLEEIDRRIAVERSLERELADLDRAFFDDWMPILSEAQWPGLDAVRARRDRARALAATGNSLMYTGRDLDLTAVLAALDAIAALAAPKTGEPPAAQRGAQLVCKGIVRRLGSRDENGGRHQSSGVVCTPLR